MVSDVEFVLFVSIPDYAPRCYRLQEDRVKIGRGRRNDITLDNSMVSSAHCEFSRDAESGKWYFRDLGSTNGSKANGHRVTSDPVAIRDGDQILLGEEIRIHFCEVRELQNSGAEDLDEEEDLDVNPVAAAVARQVREDQEGGQTVRLRNTK